MAFQLPPLPNFSVTPTPQPDFLQKAGQVASLRNMQSETALRNQLAPLDVQEKQGAVQAQATANQVAQLELKSRKAMMDAWSDPNFVSKVTTGDGAEASGHGFDPNSMLTELTSRGVEFKDAQSLTNSFLERSKNIALMTKDQQATYEKAHDSLAELLAPIVDMSVDKAGPALAAVKQKLMKGPIPGLDQTDAALVQHADLEHLGPMINVLGLNGRIADFHKKQSDTAKAGTEATKAQAELPGGPLQPVEPAELADFLKNPPKGYPATPVGFAKWKASLAPQAQINVQSSMLNDAALDQSAQRYLQTGQLPAGMRSPAMSAKIINRAGELGAGQSISANSAAFEANKKSYDNATKTLDTLTAFENVGKKNLENFLDLAKDIPDTGVPWINKPVRSLSKDLVGSDKMPAIDAARTVALREIARITNDPKLSGVLSDSARGEVEGLIPNNATLPQIRAVAKVLLQDVDNVHSSVAAQKADIGKRLGLQPSGEAGGGAKYKAPANAPSATGANGHKIVVDGGKWVDAETGKPI